ncbi:diaminopimelate decarboxylase [Fodinicurvata sp. EGI_FJ10296]|uniref:diaminopimelate decarboxylase n=1 Tax=Fodinicurvata sp. EGI_FJ10296 TaxID=3231908 RepID=UPI0034523643
MTFFSYRGGILHAEDVPLDRIAAAVGTPAYVYSRQALIANYRNYADALDRLSVRICYALKANDALAVIGTLAAEGAGADVVSAGELRRAMAAGISPSAIIFSGVGKSRDDIRLALEVGIGQINVESIPELHAIANVAAKLGKRAPIAIRVNPDVDAGTHDKITTGRKENKFGIDIDRAPSVFADAAAFDHVDPIGVAVHIGSQLTSLAPFEAAYGRVAELVRTLRNDGIPLTSIDLGGGMGIDYQGEAIPEMRDYAALIERTVGGLGCHLTIEPGRSIAGPAGVLLATTLYIKEGDSRRFAILDAGMNDLIRPALYEAWHDIQPIREPDGDAPDRDQTYDVVGPICESGDTFARHRRLGPLASGDLVAFRHAGAYGAVMASRYNARPGAVEVLVDGSEFAIVRKRPTFEQTIENETMPPWMTPPRQMEDV